MLKFAPTNEQEVVFLFAYICKELGYTVKRVQEDFPDCILIDKNNKELKAEFEYLSSHFIAHDHRISECDMIIVWKDDKNLKKNVPIIELNEYFSHLPKNPDIKIEDIAVNKTLECLYLIRKGDANKDSLLELFQKYHPRERKKEPIRFIARLISNGGEPYVKNGKLFLHKPDNIKRMKYGIGKENKNVLNQARALLEQIGIDLK